MGVCLPNRHFFQVAEESTKTTDFFKIQNQLIHISPPGDEIKFWLNYRVIILYFFLTLPIHLPKNKCWCFFFGKIDSSLYACTFSVKWKLWGLIVLRFRDIHLGRMEGVSLEKNSWLGDHPSSSSSRTQWVETHFEGALVFSREMIELKLREFLVKT